VVGIGITAAVYGTVALIVKMDDIGLYMAATARTGFGRLIGTGLVKGMPKLMALLSAVGTLAMLWVGGSIIIHGAEGLGWAWPYDAIHHLAVAAGAVAGDAAAAVEWLVTAGLDGIFGLALGLVLIPAVSRVFVPLVAALRGSRQT
jgi:predicted DNA repair protein MutK